MDWTTIPDGFNMLLFGLVRESSDAVTATVASYAIIRLNQFVDVFLEVIAASLPEQSDMGLAILNLLNMEPMERYKALSRVLQPVTPIGPGDIMRGAGVVICYVMTSCPIVGVVLCGLVVSLAMHLAYTYTVPTVTGLLRLSQRAAVTSVWVTTWLNLFSILCEAVLNFAKA
ncbi:hypothetical protein NLU13_2401 [Sarocladium strictum]|uniref:Uncharacterized protein n=1 Tax=Sarocladium strictum TaxID=5046 RepID=A0AA39GVJ3_SARSR|nr:hypothetical protein NLU13_2401 [Sarocladium strictum]